MSDDLDLKPCPLCGWSPQLATSFGEPVAGCVNRSCDLCDTEWFDVDAWNARPVEDALRARAEKAEAALAAARAEGAAAERAAVVAMLRADLGSFEVANADADDYVRDLIKDIEDGVHPPPRGGRITAAQEGA
jgi:hypothetical protein